MSVLLARAREPGWASCSQQAPRDGCCSGRQGCPQRHPGFTAEPRACLGCGFGFFLGRLFVSEKTCHSTYTLPPKPHDSEMSLHLWTSLCRNIRCQRQVLQETWKDVIFFLQPRVSRDRVNILTSRRHSGVDRTFANLFTGFKSVF